MSPQACVAAIAITVCLPCRAQTTDDTDVGQIVLAISAPMTGPSAGIGRSVVAGLRVAVAEQNAAGGISGRRLSALVRDDGYEPLRTAANMRYFAGRDDVLAVTGNVGTPTAIAALPIALDHGLPFVGPVTGAGLLRKSPPEPVVFNFRASYTQEVAAAIDRLVQSGVRPDAIAFFTQRDGYGDAGFWAGAQALAQHGVRRARDVPHGRYERNTLAVEHGLADLLESGRDIDAVVLVGTSSPNAKFVRLARQYGLDAVYVGLSFCDAAGMSKQVDAGEAQLFVTQVVPDPSADLPASRRFTAAWRTHGPEAAADRLAFEGYLIGRMTIEAIQSIPGPITRAALTDSLEAMKDHDLGLPEPLTLSATDRQACDRVYLTQVKRNGVVSVSWDRLAGQSRAPAIGRPQP